MFELKRRTRPAAAAVFVSMFLVACGDDDPVRDEFGPESAEELASVASEVMAVGGEAEEIQANLFNVFGALGGGAGELASVTPFAVMERMRAGATAAFRGFEPELSQMGPLGILLPEELEGVTFVWDVESRGYVASDESGAPENGARFIVYAVDPFSREPTEPLTPRGHLDLVDESTEEVARLEISVVDADDDVIADFFMRGSVDSVATAAILDLSSQGFVRGDDRLDFDVQMSFRGDETTDASEVMTRVRLLTDDGEVRLNHVETDDASAGYDASVRFLVRGGGNEAEFDVDSEGADEGSALVDGVLAFNGEDVVVLSGPVANPTFSTPDGGDLGMREIQAVAGMWDAFLGTYAFAILHLFPFLLLMAVSGF